MRLRIEDETEISGGGRDRLGLGGASPREGVVVVSKAERADMEGWDAVGTAGASVMRDVPRNAELFGTRFWHNASPVPGNEYTLGRLARLK